VAALAAAGAAVAATPDDFGQLDERRAALLAALDFGGLPNSLAVAMLEDPFPQARAEAARVLASEADPARVALVRQYAGDADLWARSHAMVAAGRIGRPALAVALGGLHDAVPVVRQSAAWAACHGGEEAFDAIATLLGGEREEAVLETALANLWRLGERPWEAEAARFAGRDEPGLRRAAAASLARSRRPQRAEALRRLAGDVEPVIRATALAGFADGPIDEADRRAVLGALGDPDWRVQAAACQVLAARPEIGLPSPAATALVALWAAEPAQLAVEALRAAARRPSLGEDAALLAIARGDEPWLAAEALAALARRGSALARELATAWIGDGELWRRRAAAATAPLLPAEAAAVIERQAAGDPEPAVRLAWLEALDGGSAASRSEALRALLGRDGDAAVRARAVELLQSAGALRDPEAALELYRSWKGDAMADARSAALVAALALSAEAERQAVVEIAVADPGRVVGATVVNEARRLGLAASLPAGEPRHGREWYRDLLRWIELPRWLDVVTVRGTFRIRLELADAPISSRELWELAESGFYDGLTIHRVVPNFVVQGGDPRGDGWGGPGFVLPDEPSIRPFDSWRVGIATSGPQTGGCQLFVTELPADRLTGHYTNLGEVVSGREVLTRLRVGDRIVRVSTASGPEPPRPPAVLMGRLSWPQLEGLDGWRAEHDGYLPQLDAVARLASAEGSYRVIAVLGTWCEDSAREVPRLRRVLDEVGSDRFELLLVGVDRTKKVGDAEVAALLPGGTVMERVPTIFVLDELGVELGRVVETAERPLEELLAEFIAPVEGWP
jgi:cyclophilin family peptidyl-prolyl cis-trans isomerase